MIKLRYRSTIAGFALLVLGMGGCSPASKSSSSEKVQAEPASPVAALPSDIPKIEGGGVTVLPDAVKGKWRAVRLILEDKTAQTSTEYVVPLNSRWAVPQTSLVVEVADFLPDFTIQGSVFTSVTPEPSNPAVKVTVLEGGKPVFDAWLFSLYPSVHPFTHPRYGLVLKEGISAS